MIESTAVMFSQIHALLWYPIIAFLRSKCWMFIFIFVPDEFATSLALIAKFITPFYLIFVVKTLALLTYLYHEYNYHIYSTSCKNTSLSILHSVFKTLYVKWYN